MPSGGKRPGAGRPAGGRSTKTIRVPLDFPSKETIIDIQKLLQGYYDELKKEPEREKLARWKKLSKLLSQIKEIDPEFLK